MRATLRLAALVPGVGTLLLAGGVRAQLLITGNDEKVSFDENTGKTITHPAGKDTVSIIDISDPAKPKIVVNLPLMNTITGPPVNLAITPDRHLALVANSLDWVCRDIPPRCAGIPRKQTWARHYASIPELRERKRKALRRVPHASDAGVRRQNPSHLD
jgi:hypothetical protein